MAADGVSRALAFVTSAFSSYSGAASISTTSSGPGPQSVGALPRSTTSRLLRPSALHRVLGGLLRAALAEVGESSPLRAALQRPFHSLSMAATRTIRRNWRSPRRWWRPARVCPRQLASGLQSRSVRPPAVAGARHRSRHRGMASDGAPWSSRRSASWPTTWRSNTTSTRSPRRSPALAAIACAGGDPGWTPFRADDPPLIEERLAAPELVGVGCSAGHCPPPGSSVRRWRCCGDGLPVEWRVRADQKGRAAGPGSAGVRERATDPFGQGACTHDHCCPRVSRRDLSLADFADVTSTSPRSRCPPHGPARRVRRIQAPGRAASPVRCT